MANVIVDIQEGAEIAQRSDGFTATRVAYIHGLTGSADERMYRAMIDPKLPGYNEPHPVIPGIGVTEKRAAVETAGVIAVTILYAPVVPDFGGSGGDDDAVRLEIGTTLQQMTTERDVQGNQIFTEHTVSWGTDPATGRQVTFDPEHNTNDWTATTTVKEHQVGTVRYLKPMTVLRYSRIEQDNPLAKSKWYTGTINSKGILGDPRYWWLCKRLSGAFRASRGDWRVQYEFQRNTDDWNATIIHTKKDGSFIDDPKPGKSIRTFIVYPQRDFRALDLRAPSFSRNNPPWSVGIDWNKDF